MAQFLAEAGDIPAERVALLLTAGLVLGTFPVMGCPTVLCLLAAGALRLNVAALQVLNQVTSPLQWGLLIPFGLVGARICGGAGLPVTNLGATMVYAIAGWALLGVPMGIATYTALVYVLRRRRTESSAAAA